MLTMLTIAILILQPRKNQKRIMMVEAAVTTVNEDVLHHKCFTGWIIYIAVPIVRNDMNDRG
jgi:hypothetical protein